MMAGAGHHQQPYFLDYCFLCRKRLARNRDIYMYKGDAYCTMECRNVCIEADEAVERAEKARAKAKRQPTHGPSTAREVDGPQECGKVRAGSVLAL